MILTLNALAFPHLLDHASYAVDLNQVLVTRSWQINQMNVIYLCQPTRYVVIFILNCQFQEVGFIFLWFMSNFMYFYFQTSRIPVNVNKSCLVTFLFIFFSVHRLMINSLV